jgi:hypothetical protein
LIFGIRTFDFPGLNRFSFFHQRFDFAFTSPHNPNLNHLNHF